MMWPRPGSIKHPGAVGKAQTLEFNSLGFTSWLQHLLQCASCLISLSLIAPFHQMGILIFTLQCCFGVWEDCTMVGVAAVKVKLAFFQGLGLSVQKGFQIDCRSLHLLRTDALVGDILALASSHIDRMGSLVLGLSNFSFPWVAGVGSWAVFLVIWTHPTLYRICEGCPLEAPSGPPDHTALTGCCPWFFRSPRPLHPNVHCLRGSNYQSGEWYGGGGTSVYKFPQAVFSFRWVMNLFFLFEALQQLHVYCPVPVLKYPEIPILPWLQFYLPPPHPPLFGNHFNFILLILLKHYAHTHPEKQPYHWVSFTNGTHSRNSHPDQSKHYEQPKSPPQALFRFINP